MKIAVCGAQSPFMTGGAEQLMENLVREIRNAGHEADLVRLPVAWESSRVLQSALAWRVVDVIADMVIATNFPSYFVRHPRKVIWLCHQHRAAYDAADSPWSDFNGDSLSLETQQVLADWDARVIAEARATFAISDVVAERLLRFNGLHATPLYHPAPLQERLHDGPYGDFMLVVSRLEENKRVDLAIRAHAASERRLRLVVAGRGGALDELKKLAAELGIADSVEFLGFVPDDRLVELLATCRAVIYAPYDEDYGYATLQAFASGKCVVTASDSGGVLEWVRDGETGFVTAPDAGAMAKALDSLAGDPETARVRGAAGAVLARQLSWRPVVERLVSSAR